ncbi:MAG: RNA polymerase sigma factor [Clostridiales bacterium]|nr:RNA polymerase sigma factor [Clostridiales bacterium]
MDKELFVREIEGCSGMLYRVAYSILRNDDACMDAMQETALKAWEKRYTLREQRYFRTWVTRICINTCRSMQSARRRLVSIEDVPEPAFSPPDPALDLALAALPESLRLPLVLCYCEGMTYAEVATTLRLPVATVRGRIHRAKMELRKELDAE